MKLLILFAAVTFVAANSLVGSKSCTWGPSYWCSHISRAKQCGAVDHCMSTVWKHQIIQPKSTAECLYCQMGFNELKDVLADPAIEKDISKYVADVCKILPDPDWKLICSGIVTENLPIVLQMLDNKLNSGMICATMGMCSGLEYTLKPTEETTNTQVEEKLKNTYCADCTKFFQDVQQSITSPETENELAQLFNQLICDKIPSLTQVCKDAVNEVIPNALQFLADQLDPSVTCRVFGFCGSSRPTYIIPLKNVFKNLKQPLKYRSSEECEACKEIMGELVDELRDNNTQAFVVSFLKTNVCKNLGALAAECNDIVDQYTSELFELLVNELDPSTVCEMVGLCAVPTGGLKVPVGILEPAMLISSGYKADSTPTCYICELAMQEVANILRNNVTIKSMEDLIDKVCNKFPSDVLKNQCLKFANNLGPEVIDLLKKDFDPKTICSELQLCAAKSGSALKDMKKAECDLCILGVHEVEVFVANRSTESLMTDFRSLCVFLPGNYSTKCMTYVNQYLPIVINLLKSKEDPRALCQLGGLCTSTVAHRPFITRPIPGDTVQVVVNDVSPVKVKASEVCELCNTAILILKEELGNNATEAEIKDAIEGLCKNLPASFVSECQSLVAQYGDQIIKLLLSHSNEICKEIGLCPSTVDSMHGLVAGILSPLDTLPIAEKKGEKEQGNDKNPGTVESKTSCTVCNDAIIAIKFLLQDPAMEKALSSEMETFCTVIPKAEQEACKMLVQEYGIDLIDLLLQKIDPSALCREVALCSSTVTNAVGIQAGIISPVNTLPFASEGDVKESKLESGVSCEVCTTILTMADEALQQTSTQEAIKEVMLSVCKELGSSIDGVCEELVDKYLRAAINYIILSETPASLCSKIKFCPSTNKLRQPVNVDLLPALPKRVDLSNAVTCEVCEYAMSYLEGLLGENRTEAAVKVALDELCGYLPSSFMRECKSLVDTYSDEIIRLIVTELASPQTICKDLGLCTAVDKLSPKSKVSSSSVNAGAECVICKLIMGELEKQLETNASKAEIEAALEKVCSVLPKAISAECQSFVAKYSEIIVNLLEKKASPAEICKLLKLCTADKLKGLATMVKLLPAKHDPSQNDGASTKCVICKYVMTALESVLETNATQEEIKSALEEVCSLLPVAVSAECQDFVKEYSAVIINLLEKEASPAEICSLIKLCTADKMTGLLTTMVKMLPTKGKVAADYCVPCKQVVNYIKLLLGENVTKEEIITYLKRTCDVLPDTVTVQCEDAVEQYVPAIMDLIQQDLSPEQICIEIKLCNATSQKADDKLYFHPRARLLGGEKCTYGPSYWCATEENAKRCNAEEHCRRYVWNN